MVFVGGQRLLTFKSKLRDVATYFLLFSIFSVVALWRYYRGVFPLAMPFHVFTRISSLDGTTCKGRST